MEKQQWLSKNRQAVAMELERTDDDHLKNGISTTTTASSSSSTTGGDLHRGTDNENPLKVDESKVDRNSRIRQVVEAAVSDISRKTIENILDQVKTLTPTEHLLLYLKLPTECSNAGDPLRQPLNPLGSRSEISQTIMWIKTHLEEDPELSLPKQDVYNEYYAFCGPNKIKPLSTADFGKVMKQVYPKVRPRRLGTRGNSRYCYAGLRRRLKLDPPLLRDLSDKPQSSEVSCSSADLLSAGWTIVKEWSEHQLGTQFPSLQALACYLVLNLSVGNGSGAAALVTSAAKSPFKQGDALQSDFVYSNKHRETQLQLQRKLQQRNEMNREQKRKMQLQSPKAELRTRGSKRCKIQSQSVSNVSPTTTAPSSSSSSACCDAANNTSSSQGLQSVCDKSIDFTTLQALPDFSSFQKPPKASPADQFNEHSSKEGGPADGGGEGENNPTEPVPKIGKVAIPRLNNNNNNNNNNNLSKFSPLSSPKRAKNAKYKAIQPKPESCDINAPYSPQQQQHQQQAQFPLNAAVDYRSQETTYAHNRTGRCESRRRTARIASVAIAASCKSEMDTSLATLDVSLPRERLISIGDIDKSALDDYLGTNNSQEQEEELVKYFENKEKSPSEQDKLSQLRQLFITQQNLSLDPESQASSSGMTEPECPDDVLPGSGPPNPVSLLGSDGSAFTKTNFKCAPILPGLATAAVHHYYAKGGPDAPNYSSVRRRVSFETLQQEEAAVPPSPNTRRKNFDFTPISPGPVSPGGGRQSKCSSTTASPFVSPRITPVPRAKGTAAHHPSCYVVNQTGAMVPGYPRKPPAPMSAKPMPKIKQEVADNVHEAVDPGGDFHSQLLVSTDTGGYHLPMSAPVSPKLPIRTSKNSNLLQKLLNSNNRVTYVPNYSRSQSLTGTLAAAAADPLSSEISQLFSNSVAHQLNPDTGYRSQSVPLHQMAFRSNCHQPLLQGAPFLPAPLFPFPGSSAAPSASSSSSSSSSTVVPQMAQMQGEFGDFDSFSGGENVNVTKILSTLDACSGPEGGGGDIFTGGMSDLGGDALNNNLTLSSLAAAAENFDAHFSRQGLAPSSSSSVVLSSRGLGRSQSIDVDTVGMAEMDLHLPAKYNPSRSVPGTPVPYSGSKIGHAKNFRSYPSTPLAVNETFCYNHHGQDYLLNGQPIKEKVGEDGADADPADLRFFQGSESNDEEMYQNVDMFGVTDAGLNCDILIGDNKSQFILEGQISSEGNYNPKGNMEPVPDEGGCVMNGNDYEYKNATTGNH